MVIRQTKYFFCEVCPLEVKTDDGGIFVATMQIPAINLVEISAVPECRPPLWFLARQYRILIEENTTT